MNENQTSRQVLHTDAPGLRLSLIVTKPETTVVRQPANRRQYNTSQYILLLRSITQTFYVHSLPD